MAGMRVYEWDDVKSQANEVKHGMSFEVVESFGWADAVVIDTARPEDGETRAKAIGPLGERLYTLVFTMRGDITRVISFRRSNNAEIKRWSNV
ncbi:MAG: BrnT family toxin [Sphingomonadales bacterium]